MFLYLAPLVLPGQSNFDSLRNVIASESSDSIKMNAAYAISRDICHTIPDSGIAYGWKAYEYAKNAGVKTGEASAYSQIAYSYNKKELIDSALLYWNKSVDIYKDLGKDFLAAYIMTNSGSTLSYFGRYDEAEKILLDAKDIMVKLDSQRHIVNIWNNLGLTFDLKGDYDKGYAYYMKAYETGQSFDDINGMATSLNNMSVMYYYKGDYRKSLQYGKRALKLWSEEKYLSSRSKAVKNMAVSFEFLGQLDSAVIMHEKAITMDTKLTNDFGLAKTYNNLGCLYGDLGNLELGLEYLNKALEIKSKFNIREGIGTTYNYLGYIHTKKGLFAKAKNYLDQGKRIAIANSNPEDMKDNLSFFEEYYTANLNYKSALAASKEYQLLKDSLFNVETETKIEELNIKYETAKKDAENAKLELENEKGRSTITKQKNTIFGGALALVLLGLLLNQLRRQRNKLKISNDNLITQKETIVLLNQELNHRVKNNLAFITTLMQMQSRRATQQETKELLKDSENRLLALLKVHGNLKQGDSTSIRIGQYLSDIIDNLQSAFQSDHKKMILHKEIKNLEIDAESAMRIGLITNELITNSMKHVDKPVVKVKISLDQSLDETIILRYEDNGSGIERHLNSEKSKESMGLLLIDILRKQLKGKIDVVLV